MIPRQHPLGDRAILFASRGASAQLEENTLESFRVALRLGATGIETDLLASADGRPLLRRKPKTSGLRRRNVAEVDRASLGDAVVTLDELYAAVGNGFDVLLHVRAPEAVESAIVEATRARALERLWLVASDLDLLTSWRERSPLVKLVHLIGPEHFDQAPERHASELRTRRIDAVASEFTSWNGGRVALYHRFSRRCFATEAVHERHGVKLLHIGLDGVSSAHPDRLADAAAEVWRPDAPEIRDE